MADNDSIYAGVDIGASRTKVALLDSGKNLTGFSIKKSGTDFSRTAEDCLAEAIFMAKTSRENIVKTVSTGYGRNNVAFSNDTKTEIGCHARGAFHYFPKAMTIIDIGGQDNKIIKLE